MARTAVVVAVALAVPVLLIVSGFRLAATDGFVRFAYDRAGFPVDRFGLEGPARLELALVGLESISPGSEGIALLRRARLPGGEQAFNGRELTHMEDVRGVFGGALRLQVILGIAVAALALVLARSRLAGAVGSGLLAGALLTLGIAVVAIPVVLLGFDGVFLRFHQVFFEGESWRFPSSDTLIRIYPEAFWVTTAQLIAAATLAQAVVIVLAVAVWKRWRR